MVIVTIGLLIVHPQETGPLLPGERYSAEGWYLIWLVGESDFTGCLATVGFPLAAGWARLRRQSPTSRASQRRVLIGGFICSSDERPDNPKTAASPEPADWMLRYEPWLKLIARMQINSRFAGKFSASDAVQQTLVEAWRCWDDFRGQDEEQRLAWLRRILANQMAQLARRYAGARQA